MFKPVIRALLLSCCVGLAAAQVPAPISAPAQEPVPAYPDPARFEGENRAGIACPHGHRAEAEKGPLSEIDRIKSYSMS